MSDRELLEAAAKAAGIPILPCTCRHEKWPFKHDESVSGKHGHWNPLTDDGDALRLAVKQFLDIQVDAELTAAITPLGGKFTEPYRGDPAAATRRAIVRAAASRALGAEGEQ